MREYKLVILRKELCIVKQSYRQFKTQGWINSSLFTHIQINFLHFLYIGSPVSLLNPKVTADGIGYFTFTRCLGLQGYISDGNLVWLTFLFFRMNWDVNKYIRTKYSTILCLLLMRSHDLLEKNVWNVLKNSFSYQ